MRRHTSSKIKATRNTPTAKPIAISVIFGGGGGQPNKNEMIYMIVK